VLLTGKFKLKTSNTDSSPVKNLYASFWGIISSSCKASHNSAAICIWDFSQTIARVDKSNWLPIQAAIFKIS
jgi:hypothetical protein